MDSPSLEPPYRSPHSTAISRRRVIGVTFPQDRGNAELLATMLPFLHRENDTERQKDVAAKISAGSPERSECGSAVRNS